MQKKPKDLKLNKKKIGKFYICKQLDNKNETENILYFYYMRFNECDYIWANAQACCQCQQKQIRTQPKSKNTVYD